MTVQVAAFTDTYLPTVNGVSYTIRTWRERFNRQGDRMEVVFPGTPAYDPATYEYPVKSVAFPFYDGFRVGQPRLSASLSSSLSSVDVVHAHTPFAIGIAARRLATRRDRPLVASYHTPAAEYASYLAPTRRVETLVRRGATAYERWFYDHADLVLTPTRAACREVSDRLGISTPIEVVSNGVDLERFTPGTSAAFRERHGLEPTATLVGYTGRHGCEKNLSSLLEAATDLEEVTIVFGGDGPARATLERQATTLGVDARFLGFLDRRELAEFYRALDVFAFPSPVETQGLVALEAIACGTPVVAVDAGALSESVEAGVTGVQYQPGDIEGFQHAIRRALANRTRLEAGCLERRQEFCVDRSLLRLRGIYESL